MASIPDNDWFVFHLTTMGSVESTRMYLWWYMISRSQMHLAHHVLENGFKVIEYLRRADKPLWEHNAQEFARWKAVLSPYLTTLESIRLLYLSNRWSDKTANVIGGHQKTLGNLGYAKGHEPLSTTPQATPTPTPNQEGQGPCGDARSQGAADASPHTSSPAHDTGMPSAGTNSGESTPHTTGGEAATSHQPISGQSKQKSSGNMKRIRGTGHPKRSNPYTRAKKGKA